MTPTPAQPEAAPTPPRTLAQKLKDALAFYAEPDTWLFTDRSTVPPLMPALRDCGSRARAALADPRLNVPADGRGATFEQYWSSRKGAYTTERDRAVAESAFAAGARSASPAPPKSPPGTPQVPVVSPDTLRTHAPDCPVYKGAPCLCKPAPSPPGAFDALVDACQAFLAAWYADPANVIQMDEALEKARRAVAMTLPPVGSHR